MTIYELRTHLKQMISLLHAPNAISIMMSINIQTKGHSLMVPPKLS